MGYVWRNEIQSHFERKKRGLPEKSGYDYRNAKHGGDPMMSSQRQSFSAIISTSKDQIEGILISKVKSSSYAWRAGFKSGDIIVSANRYRVRGLDDLKKVVNASARGSLLLNIQRGRDAFFLVLN